MKNSNKNNLPEKFLARCQQIFGSYCYEKMKNTFIERPTTFRVNTLKAAKEEILTVLQREGFKTKRINWYGEAFILENKRQKELTELTLYQDGKIYLQSLASMVPPLVLDARPGEKVLDLTAAPGSKTSQIAAMMNKTGELIANEINPLRFAKLEHNMSLLGVSGGDFLQLKNEDGAKLCLNFQNYFDKILLDAPCGAEARIVAKDIRTYGFWDERKIKDNAYLQRKLLFSAWSALKPGGTLVYSTCTFAPEENEEQIERLLEKFPGEVKIVKAEIRGLNTAPAVLDWNNKRYKEQIKGCLRMLPDKEVEGFFVAKLVKV